MEYEQLSRIVILSEVRRQPNEVEGPAFVCVGMGV